MSDVTTQQSEQKNSDSCADAIAAIATVSIFIIAVIFWISNQ